MNRRRSLCSAPMLVAVGALFVALSGSATAAVLLTGNNIKNGSLTHADLAKETILSKNIRDGHVMRRDLSPALQQAIDRTSTVAVGGADGAKGNDGTAGKSGAAGAAGTKGDTGATGAAGAPGDAGPPGVPGAPGRDGASGVAWGTTVNAWTELTGWPGTDVAEGTVDLAAGSTGLVLTGIAQPSTFDTPASGSVSCYFLVDGESLDDDSQGQTYIPPGLPNFSTMQLTTLARVSPGDYGAGQHDIALRCWTSASNLYTSVASFTALETADPVITG